jgi:hypothetical protein
MRESLDVYFTNKQESGTMDKISTVLILPHVKDCSSLQQVKQGFWPTPWFIQGRYERRDKIGRKHPHGSYRWFVAECNSTKCAAELLVKSDDIERLLPSHDPLEPTP